MNHLKTHQTNPTTAQYRPVQSNTSTAQYSQVQPIPEPDPKPELFGQTRPEPDPKSKSPTRQTLVTALALSARLDKNILTYQLRHPLLLIIIIWSLAERSCSTYISVCNEEIVNLRWKKQDDITKI